MQTLSSNISESSIIHVIWTGPVPFEKVKPPEFVGYTDFGVYQIYGTHPVHGHDVLLYIGRSAGGSFGWRIPQHAPMLKEENVGEIRVHLGRLAGEATPPDDVWNRRIDLAELLLIFAHKPPLNQRIGLGKSETELQNVHVCNWGEKGNILPEVSGLRWTNKSKTNPMKVYEVGENAAEGAV